METATQIDVQAVRWFYLHQAVPNAVGWVYIGKVHCTEAELCAAFKGQKTIEGNGTVMLWDRK